MSGTLLAKYAVEGNSVKFFTTTNRVGHLRKHPTKCKSSKEEKSSFSNQQRSEASKGKASLKQLSIGECSDRTIIWDMNDPRAVKLTRKVGEMVALDSRPFSVVENSGFVGVLNATELRHVIPCRKFITDKTIPEIYSFVQLKDELSEAKWVSCTSDIWSSTEVSNECLISLTVHWLFPTTFQRKSRVLNASPLPGSHTGDAI